MNGLYGTVRPANINPETDADLYYAYRSTRGDTDIVFTPLDSDCLVATTGVSDSSVTVGSPLNGLYTLRLPLTTFNKKGIYTIYISPKQTSLEIWDVGVLAADPSIVGVVFKMSDLDGMGLGEDYDLSGYRIEYYSDSGVHTFDRLITSSYACEKVRMITNDGYPMTARYNLTSSVSDDGLVFCTITPSTASSFKPNSAPSPGVMGQSVNIVNTKFNPILMEVELVEHDADTISTLLEGDQIRDLDNAIITTYTSNKEIFQQHEYYTLKSTNGTPLYDVKVKRDNIDQNQTYKNIVQD